jgi:hypothetical protein
MNTKLGMLKQAALAVCCAASVGAMPVAHADGFALSVGTGPAYYGGYYNPYRRCFYDYYGYYRCRPYYAGPAYYGGPYYSPGVSIGYYGGGNYRWRDRDDWRWRDRDRDDRRWRDRDHDGDRH